MMLNTKGQCLTPDWPAPKNVRSLITTRLGGVSMGAFKSLNLGVHVGDDPESVLENRRRLSKSLPSKPFWLNQVHGVEIIQLTHQTDLQGAPNADGSYTQKADHVCCVMTADCLPVLLCNKQGTQVAAVHAGWRGLLDGVLEIAIDTFDANDTLMAYLGPAIGPEAFEVGPEVREGFCRTNQSSDSAFKSVEGTDKWLADIYLLAKIRMRKKGLMDIYGGSECTFQDEERYFSYRRDGQTGRMASCIWLEGKSED